MHQADTRSDDMHIILLHSPHSRLSCVARQAQLLQLLGGCAAGPHKVPWPHGRDQRHQTGYASGCQLVLTQIKYCTCMNIDSAARQMRRCLLLE